MQYSDSSKVAFIKNYYQQVSYEIYLILKSKKKLKTVEEKQFQKNTRLCYYEKWEQYFDFVNSSQIQAVQLQPQNFYIIPISLCIPNFSELKHLNISQNLIYSIQIMAFIDAPKLQQICLSNYLFEKDDNLITSIKALGKTSWPQLQYVNYYGNKIQCVSFERMKNNDQIYQFMHEFSFQDNIVVQDISSFAKLSAKYVDFIELYSQCRIEQQKVNQCLKRKFPAVL